MDLLRDFAYAKVTADVPTAAVNAVTTVTVDDTSRLPSNAEMLAEDFWMTFESDLPTGAFEVVQVLSKTATTVTVRRGQDGDGVFAHPAGIYLKASITAAMLRRLVQYRRYIDLGNVGVAGSGACFSSPTVLRGVAAGQSGGATVVAGALVIRGLRAASAGGSSMTGAIDVTAGGSKTYAGRTYASGTY